MSIDSNVLDPESVGTYFASFFFLELKVIICDSGKASFRICMLQIEWDVSCWHPGGN